MSTTLSVSQALVLLKKTEEKLDNVSGYGILRINTRGEDPTVTVVGLNGIVDVKEAQQYLTTINQKFKDLLNLRNELKRKILISNATTTVKVGNVEMTVAEAIDRKSSISFETKWLKSIKANLANTAKRFEVDQEACNADIKERIEGNNKSGRKLTEEEAQLQTNIVNRSSKPGMIEYVNEPSAYADKLAEELSGFIDNVNYALNESNILTKIEIESKVE